MEAAGKLGLEIAAGRAPRNYSLTRSDKLSPPQEAEPMFMMAKMQVSRHKISVPPVSVSVDQTLYHG